MNDEIPRKQIILLEDDQMVSITIKTVLDTAGFPISRFAKSISEARAICENPTNDVALLISDLLLPDGSGFEFAQEMLERFPEMKALLLTGQLIEPEDVADLPTARVEFLLKPFRVVQLTSRVAELLGAAVSSNF